MFLVNLLKRYFILKIKYTPELNFLINSIKSSDHPVSWSELVNAAVEEGSYPTLYFNAHVLGHILEEHNEQLKKTPQKVNPH